MMKMQNSPPPQIDPRKQDDSPFGLPRRARAFGGRILAMLFCFGLASITSISAASGSETFPSRLSIEPAFALPDYQKSIVVGDDLNRRFGNAFVLGDFNEDGRMDFVVHVHGPDESNPAFATRVYLQDTHGVFRPIAEQALPNTRWTFFFLKGDFDEDGHLDVLMDDIGKDLVMLLGKGDGTFKAPIALGLGASGIFALGDLNGDGHLDLVAGNLDGSVGVFLGTGHGTFNSKARLGSYVIPYSPPRGDLLIADLNRDGKPDIAVASVPEITTDVGTLDVYFGNGDGTFQNVIWTDGIATRRGAFGDFNGDGILDFAGDRSSPNQLEIWLGSGDGHFKKSKAYTLGYSSVWSVKVADLNFDRIPDLIVSGEPLLPLNIFLGIGDGTFRTRQSLAAVGNYQFNTANLELVDLNGDGLLDIVGLAENLIAQPEEVLAFAISQGVKPDPMHGFLLTIGNPPDIPVTRGPLLLEATANFLDWTVLATNPAPSVLIPWRINDPIGTSVQRFYRTRLP